MSHNKNNLPEKEMLKTPQEYRSSAEHRGCVLVILAVVLALKYSGWWLLILFIL